MLHKDGTSLDTSQLCYTMWVSAGCDAGCCLRSNCDAHKAQQLACVPRMVLMSNAMMGIVCSMCLQVGSAEGDVNSSSRSKTLKTR